MAIQVAPGESAPRAGTYALMGQDGKATDLALWCLKGDRLPLIVSGDGPVWFALIG
jgi:hypothetical protein